MVHLRVPVAKVGNRATYRYDSDCRAQARLLGFPDPGARCEGLRASLVTALPGRDDGRRAIRSPQDMPLAERGDHAVGGNAITAVALAHIERALALLQAERCAGRLPSSLH
jgi:hypothetical protein